MSTPVRQPDPEDSSAGVSRRDLAAAGILLLLSGLYFTALELREPYYFLWDDNASYYLPCYAYNHDAFFGRGELPHVNYHQYLGHAYLASGQTAVLYPPLYLALAVARLGWGDLRPVVDVMAVLHFMVAALGMFFLLRRFAIGRGVAVAVALLWMSFPFLIVVARSWVFVSYAAALLPWSLWALERLLERPAVPRVLALAAVKALFLYQGYVQYAVLATLFEGSYVLLRWIGVPESRVSWRRQAFAYAAALAATAALAAPLLLPMAYAKQISAYRTGSLSFEEFISNSLSVRTFFSAQVFQMRPRAVHLSTGAIFYLGLPNLLALGALYFSRRRRMFGAVAGVALWAFLLSTPAFGMMYRVPVLSSFRWPFKSFLICLLFFSIATAGAYQVWLASRRKVGRSIGILFLAAGIGANVAIVFSRTLDSPFGPNRIERDVAEVRAEAARLFPLETGRVASFWLSPLEPRIHRFLAFNYATLTGAFHLGGYDPLISREHLELALRQEYSNIFRYELTAEMLDYLSSWSVRFFLVPESRMFPPIERFRPALRSFPQLRLAYRVGGLEVWENGAALPFAYFVGPDPAPVDVRWGPNGVRLATGGRGGSLRVAVAPLDWYEWSADGAEMGAVAYDATRHVVVEVPPGVQEVEIRYVDVPFRLGAFVFWAFVLSVVTLWVLRRELFRGPAGRSTSGSPAFHDRRSSTARVTAVQSMAAEGRGAKEREPVPVR